VVERGSSGYRRGFFMWSRNDTRRYFLAGGGVNKAHAEEFQQAIGKRPPLARRESGRQATHETLMKARVCSLSREAGEGWGGGPPDGLNRGSGADGA